MVFLLICMPQARAEDAAAWNARILERIEAMPGGGQYAAYRRDAPEGKRFNDLYATVDSLQNAISVNWRGRLVVRPERAFPGSFCSSGTYLLFADVIATLQRDGVVPAHARLSRELADVGDTRDVIHGRLDGVGIFGHWNADGPGTAVLFHRLAIGRSFLGYDLAKPGDFLKIFWNDKIGKGERGHLVVYLGTNETGDAIEVWSSNQRNHDGSSGYGTMWVAKSRIHTALFSRLETPGNLIRWLDFSEDEKTSDYLVRIRRTPSTLKEMREQVGIAR